MFKRSLPLFLVVFLLTACTKPPSKELVKESIKQFIPLNFEVLQVSRLDEMPELYEVVIVVSKQPVVFYLDEKAKLVFSGSILSAKTKTNLTLETQKKFLPK